MSKQRRQGKGQGQAQQQGPSRQPPRRAEVPEADAHPVRKQDRKQRKFGKPAHYRVASGNLDQAKSSRPQQESAQKEERGSGQHRPVRAFRNQHREQE